MANLANHELLKRQWPTTEAPVGLQQTGRTAVSAAQATTATGSTAANGKLQRGPA